MGIHKEGLPLVVILAIFQALGLFLSFLWAPILVFWIVFALFLGLLLFVAHFFRKAKRQSPAKENTVYSPADGRVVAIEQVFEPEVLNAEVRVISVFMSVWNVHANFFPISGNVEYMRYHKGKFLVAWLPKSSTENERTSLVVRTEGGARILFRQIAGAVARRICCYAKENDTAKVGTEFGFIKFGSRVDIFIPLDAQVHVQLGDKVKACLTPLAEIR